MKSLRLLGIIAMFLHSTVSYGVVNYSTARAGAWPNASTWVTGAPVATDEVNISINHAVTGALDLTFSGMNNNVFTINSTGSLELTGELKFNGDITLNVYGRLVINGDLSFGGNNPTINVYSGGYLQVTNILTSQYKLNAPVDAGGKLIVHKTNLVNGLSANISGDFVVQNSFVSGNNTDITLSGSGNFVVGDEINTGSFNFIAPSPANIYILDPTPVCNTQSCNKDGITNYFTDPKDLSIRNEPLCAVVPNCASFLPVQLYIFQGAIKDSFVELTWTTLSEINLDAFYVERSADGKNYHSIGDVKGSGWSSARKDYVFTDHSPLPGVNYYRLKTEDYDGRVEFFTPVSIFNEQLQLFLDHSIEGRILRITSNASARISLTTIGGVSLYSAEITPGNNIFSLPASAPAGMCILAISSDRKIMRREKVFIR